MEKSHVTYVGQVLEDGHLSVDSKARKALGLCPGDQLRVTLARGQKVAESAELEALETLSRAELKRIAGFRFPHRLQTRMELLLVKNQAGQLTSTEQEELQSLSQESLLQRARKAQARMILTSRMK